MRSTIKPVQDCLIAEATTDNGVRISCHELAPGLIGIRQAGMAPLSADWGHLTRVLLSRRHSDRPGENASVTWTSLLKSSPPETLIAADKRALEVRKAAVRRTIHVSGRIRKHVPRSSAIRRERRPLDCPDDGFWHSWECDAQWWHQHFCESGFEDPWCLDNVAWVNDYLRRPHFVRLSACNASFELLESLTTAVVRDLDLYPYLYADDLWWHDGLEPRTVVTWDYFPNDIYDFVAEFGSHHAASRLHYAGLVNWSRPEPDSDETRRETLPFSLRLNPRGAMIPSGDPLPYEGWINSAWQIGRLVSVTYPQGLFPQPALYVQWPSQLTWMPGQTLSPMALFGQNVVELPQYLVVHAPITGQPALNAIPLSALVDVPT